MFKVYIRINENNEITDIDNNIHITDNTRWIFLDEGNTNRHAYAKNKYFTKPIFDIFNEKFSYKYIDGQVVEN